MKKGLTFLTGALIGVGLGILFAPKEGSETRKELQKKLSDLWDKIRVMDANEIKESLESKLEDIEKGIKELDKEKIMEIAKEKSEALKKKVEELIIKAKEAGKPVLEKTASQVKEQLIQVTKEVLKRLENSN